MHTSRFEGIGTWWEVETSDSLSEKDWSSIVQEIQEEIEDFNAYFSRFLPNSFISQLAKKKGTVTVREDLVTLLWMYIPLYHLTKGQFTPLIGHMLEEAGYDATYSLKERSLSNIPALTDAIEVLDPTHIEIKQPALIDIGAIGKGFLIDTIGQLLHKKGLSTYTVDAGGDILHKGITPLKVGLEHPDNEKMVIGEVTLQNMTICGSSGNRRKWGRFHHIINPLKKESPDHIKAVWVTAKSCALADGLSTCLFFVEPSVLLKQFSFEYCIVYSNLTVQTSPHFPGTLYS